MAFVQDPMRRIASYHSELLQTGMKEFFNGPLFSDVTIHGPDGRRVRCHKLVLTACSPCFGRILAKGLLQGMDLPVTGVDSAALEAVIKYFYTGDARLEFPSVIALYDAAMRLEVAGLSKACEEFIMGALQPSTCCWLLAQAHAYNLTTLFSLCLQCCESRFDAVVLSEGFSMAPSMIVSTVLVHCRACVPPDDLFRAAWLWVMCDLSHLKELQDVAALVAPPAAMTLPELMAMRPIAPAQRAAYEKVLARDMSRGLLEEHVLKIWPSLAVNGLPRGPSDASHPALIVEPLRVASLDETGLGTSWAVEGGGCNTVTPTRPGTTGAPPSRGVASPAVAAADACHIDLTSTGEGSGALEGGSVDARLGGAGGSGRPREAGRAADGAEGGGFGATSSGRGASGAGAAAPAAAVVPAGAAGLAGGEVQLDIHSLAVFTRNMIAGMSPQEALAGLGPVGKRPPAGQLGEAAGRRDDNDASGDPNGTAGAATTSQLHPLGTGDSAGRGFAAAAAAANGAGFPWSSIGTEASLPGLKGAEAVGGQLHTAASTAAAMAAKPATSGTKPGRGGGDVAGEAEDEAAAESLQLAAEQLGGLARAMQRGHRWAGASDDAEGGNGRRQQQFAEGGSSGDATAGGARCQVDGCGVDLCSLPDQYFFRSRICPRHAKASTVVKDGVEQRFCQPCGACHRLSLFDGRKRSCREQMATPKKRRRAQSLGNPASPVKAAAGGLARGMRRNASQQAMANLGATAAAATAAAAAAAAAAGSASEDADSSLSFEGGVAEDGARGGRSRGGGGGGGQLAPLPKLARLHILAVVASQANLCDLDEPPAAVVDPYRSSADGDGGSSATHDGVDARQ